MYASTKHEVQQVRNSKDLPGLASFEQELKQSMRRQRGSRKGTLTLPSGQHCIRLHARLQKGILMLASKLVPSLHLQVSSASVHIPDVNTAQP